jgi:hypothetical protein
MKFLTRLKNFIFGKPTEIELIEAALRRYDQRLDAIQQQWREAGGLCCPGCFSSEFVTLSNKMERVEKWLAVLKKRKNKNND